MNIVQRLAQCNKQGEIRAKGAAIVLGSALLAIVASIPGWSRFSEHARLDEALRAAMRRSESTHARIQSIRRELGTTQPSVDAAAADSLTIDSRLLQVSHVAETCALSIDSAEPGSSTRRPEGDVVTGISVAARGSFPSLVRFIHELREAAPDVTVETLQTTAAPSGSCTIRMTLSWWAAPTRPGPVVASSAEEGSR